METLDLDALTTAELYSEICNIVERGCRGLPLPGEDGDDGVRLTSEHAGAVTYAVLATVRRLAGAEPLVVDLMERVKGDNPGYTEDWYAAYVARLLHFASGSDMSTAPELPAE